MIPFSIETPTAMPPLSWFANARAMALPMQNGTAWQHAWQKLFGGMMALTLHQLEVYRDLTGAALEDFQSLGQIRRPDELLRAELAIAGKQTARFIEAARSINDEWRNCCFDSTGLMLSETAATEAAEPTPPAAPEPAKVKAKAA